MARRQDTQLALDWMAPVQWSDLPAAVRAGLTALLADLLREAAVASDREDAGHDQ